MSSSSAEKISKRSDASRRLWLMMQTREIHKAYREGRISPEQAASLISQLKTGEFEDVTVTLDEANAA